MSVDWPSVPLSDLVDPQRGISYGIVQPGSPVLSGVPIVRVSDVRNGRIDVRSPLRVSEDIERAYGRTRLRGGELLITIVGTVGETAIVPPEMAGWNVARAISVLPVKPEIGSYWVQLGLRSPAAASMIQSRLNTTVQATLNLGDLSRLPIILPPPRLRQSIAALLGALDDKIDLNRRMNETLQAMARAIFKDWCVDFGPTRAKMEGRAPYLAPDIWTLFPDRLDDEGKPEGWNNSTIGQEVDIVGGSTPSTKETTFWGGDIAWATPKDLSSLSTPVLLGTERQITDAGLSQIGSGLLPVGTVLLSSRAPIGYMAIAQIPVAINQGFIAMVCRKRLSNVFCWLWTQANIETVHQNANGSTFQEISKANFKPIGVTISTPEILKAFDENVVPLFERIVANEKESLTLAKIRDLLLPKLMSGEVRVGDAASFV
jgi:type I restriction enzyme S subunit